MSEAFRSTEVGVMWWMRVIWGGTALAVLLSAAALYLNLRAPAYEPLHEVSVEILAEELTPRESVPLMLSGCVDETTAVFIYTFWTSPDHFAHLGPATATEIDAGCRDSPVEIAVPPLGPGEWRLSMLIIATDGDRSQTVSTESNPATVAPE